MFCLDWDEYEKGKKTWERRVKDTLVSVKKMNWFKYKLLVNVIGVAEIKLKLIILCSKLLTCSWLYFIEKDNKLNLNNKYL